MLEIKTLPIDLQKIAETELGEVPNRLSSDLRALKTWIEQEPHLNARVEDQFLIQFLRGCKYSLEKAKAKIDLFYTLKTKFPQLFNSNDTNETKFRKIYNLGFGVPLPRPLKDHGSRIFFLKFEGDAGTGLMNLEDLFQVINAMHEIILLDDPYACINGIIYIVDLKQLNINMASQFTPSFLRKIVQFYEKSLPLRIKSAHMINTPGFFHGILSILLPLLTEKLRKQIFVYGQDYHNIKDMIPIEYLPSSLGGENGSTEQILKEFDKKWIEYEDYFKENANYGTKELLRNGKPIDFDSLYGLGGSFRKLDVD